MMQDQHILSPAECSRKMVALCEKYHLPYQEIGRSILGRPIEVFSMGKGNKPVLFVGAHHASEWLTAEALLRFCTRLLSAAERKTSIGLADAQTLLSRITLYVLPMLNPDGVAVQQEGAAAGGIFAERLIRQNGGSEDFTHWQANVRGVDLNHNYDAGWYEGKMAERENHIFGGGPTRYGGEFPESEPETAALCSFTRTLRPEMVVALHSQGEEIYYTFGGEIPRRSAGIAAFMAKRSGYVAAEPEGMASFSGYKDWFIQDFHRPGFTVEMGKGENPLPPEHLRKYYAPLERVLIAALLMA